MTTAVPLRAVGRVSRVTGLVIGIGWTLLLPLGAIGAGAEPVELVQCSTVAWLLPGVLLAARAPLIGVSIDGSTLKVVSWWRTYQIECDLIEEILVCYYSGYLNNWADEDILGRHVKMLGVESGDRERYFPATAMTNAAAKTVLPEIARAVGVPLSHEN
ncbi:hypothetical protein [Mycetocola zhujimingii]|uniref:hypothetical protein n=1 Tax=Mycetocola zhujimingii TaxID=2079792 RepID=UPI0013C4A2E2|nr:hypothetical protein [Mycetocola zhujimingii]